LETSATGNPSITPTKIKKLADAMKLALRDGDPAARKAYLRLFVGKIIVAKKEIRITGATAAIERAASAEGQTGSGEKVPSFVRDWYPVGMPNL